MPRAIQRLIPSVLFALLFVRVLAAETAGEANAAPVPPKNEMEIRKKFSELSAKVNEQPEIKKLKEELESAQKAYQMAFEAAMTKEDAEVMAAYRSWRESAMDRFHNPPSGISRAKEVSGYDNLTDEEKKRLFEARKQAGEAPAVKDARRKRNAAKTEDERKAAETEYKTELRNAMLGTDSKLGELLDKLEGREKAPVDSTKN